MSQDWPLASSYTRMIQTPKMAFKEPELQQCTIKRDDHNQPLGLAGQFAVVYKGTLANQKNIAIRAFTCENDERTGRYHAISEHLAQVPHLKSLVGFKYYEKGIRAVDRSGKSRMYPLVTMDWVPGEGLYSWVKNNALDRKQQPLRQLADNWVELNAELVKAKIAHGDLQHGNILVTGKQELKLVDYDCMCVPKLVGRRNLEIGVEPYQHPKRNGDTKLSPDLDNFSAIFIFLALRALAAAPRLWDVYVEQKQYDKLLIAADDFKEPTQSRLFQELLKSPDSDVPRIAKDLFDLYRGEMSKVPSLSDVVFSWDRVGILLSQKQFQEAAELIKRQPAGKAPPAHLKSGIQNAIARVDRLKALEVKVKAGDETGMSQLYDPKLLDDFPAAAAAVKIARQATNVLAITKQLSEAKQSQSVRDLVRVWDANQALLDSRPSTQTWKSEVVTWRKRNEACDALLKVLKQPVCDPAQLSNIWSSLQSLGGHPEADRCRSEVENRIKRDSAWAKFTSVPSEATESADAKLVQAWNEALFAGWDVAEKERQRVNQARLRLNALKQLQAADAQFGQNLTLDSERALVAQSAALSSGYSASHSARIDVAKTRVRVVEAFQKALGEPINEEALLTAFQQCDRAKAVGLLDTASRVRAELAQKRVPLLGALHQVSSRMALDQLDSQLIKIWKPEILDACEEAKPWRQQYRDAVARCEILGHLRSAIESKNEPRIAKLVGNPLLRKYPLPGEWSHVIEDAKERMQRKIELMEALSSGNRELFALSFDQQLIRECSDEFLPYEQTLRAWLLEEILPRQKIGLNQPIAAGSLVKVGQNGHYKAKWLWPERRISEQCYLTISRQLPKFGDDPSKMRVEFCDPITREQYQGASGSRDLHVKPTWAGCHVAVWAILDLGFGKFASEPLILGRLSAPEAPKTNNITKWLTG